MSQCLKCTEKCAICSSEDDCEVCEKGYFNSYKQNEDGSYSHECSNKCAVGQIPYIPQFYALNEDVLPANILEDYSDFVQATEENDQEFNDFDEDGIEDAEDEDDDNDGKDDGEDEDDDGDNIPDAQDSDDQSDDEEEEQDDEDDENDEDDEEEEFSLFPPEYTDAPTAAAGAPFKGAVAFDDVASIFDEKRLPWQMVKG